MNGNTKKAILHRLNTLQYSWFMIGSYFYQMTDNMVLRRRPQEPGRLPTGDWELVPVKWDGNKWVF